MLSVCSFEALLFNNGAGTVFADVRLIVVAVRADHNERIAICTECARLALPIITTGKLEFGVGPFRAKITVQLVHEAELGLLVLWLNDSSALILFTIITLLVFLAQLDALLQANREDMYRATITGAR